MDCVVINHIKHYETGLLMVAVEIMRFREGMLVHQQICFQAKLLVAFRTHNLGSVHT
jgi:hypothetical protein